MNVSEDFDAWLLENADEVDQSIRLSIAPLPDEPAARADALGRANTDCARMGFLLTEAESYVLRTHASAVLEVRSKYPEMQYSERITLAKAEPLHLRALKIRDDLKVVVEALSRRSYSIMNLNKNTFQPNQQRHG